VCPTTMLRPCHNLNSSGIKPILTRSYNTLRARAVVFEKTGKPREAVSVHSYDIPAEPSGGKVIVKFLAAPINPADLNQIEGVYPSAAVFGNIKDKDVPCAVGGNEGVCKIISVGPGPFTGKGTLRPGNWAIMRHPSVGILQCDRVDNRHMENLR
jgi:mitochondrial enoyl-[acyl-carrier protein] reductase / trans-2-enoyl-CoA reductase